jgi:hypothetical protein
VNALKSKVNQDVQNERFMVVAFTEPQPLHRTLSEWPQHMTILPWLCGYRRAATSRIIDVLVAYGPLTVSIGGADQFDDGEIQAWTVGPTDVLANLHQAVLNAALRNDTSVIDLTRTGAHYQPHITQNTEQPELHAGDTITLPIVSVIGSPLGGKEVLTNIELLP